MEPVFRYFYFPNAQRPHRLGGFLQTPERVGKVGSVWDGIMVSKDPGTLKDLDKLIAEDRFGVVEITETKYNELKKKANLIAQDRRVRLTPSPSFASPTDKDGVVIPAAVPVAKDPNPVPKASDVPAADLVPAPAPVMASDESAEAAAKVEQAADTSDQRPAKRPARRKPSLTKPE